VARQAIARQGKRLILPMGRGRKALSFSLDLPARIGGVCLVWNGAYALHVVVPAPASTESPGVAQVILPRICGRVKSSDILFQKEDKGHAKSAKDLFSRV
jgi:hypothetical protein